MGNIEMTVARHNLSIAYKELVIAENKVERLETQIEDLKKEE